MMTIFRFDGPMTKEIATYMRTTLACIAGPWKNATELKTWWFSQREKDMRAALVIVGTTPEHKQLYNAFLKRGNELSAETHIRNAAE